LKEVKASDHLFRMKNATPPEDVPPDELQKSLADLARSGSPAIAALAQWVLAHPQEIAFQSVRGLAALSGANVNTVYRLSLALGFAGYDECRRAFQAALRRSGGLYGTRAARLNTRGEGELLDELRAAAHANLEEAFTPESASRIREAASRLLRARRIYCIGVRSCFSLAHYFAYTGGMAFPNFERPFLEPGSISDTLAGASAEDVAVLITFSRYSAEVVRAHEAALAQGTGVIAITDSYAAPIAREADLVFCLSMAGPQPLPSHGAGFAIVEAIVLEMISKSTEAPARVAEFERRLLSLGSYVKDA
jgi:DNA-binding MurR/RpiR family transcriptional regulator